MTSRTLSKIDFELQSSRPFLVDYHKPTNKNAPILIFMHGFKGFKDWGGFNALAEYWVRQGFLVFKVNFSHNGTTPDAPQDFEDLEAFGHNSLTKELEDTRVLIDYIFDNKSDLPSRNLENVCLVGHSRGGSTAIIYASQDKRITKVASLSAVADLEARYFHQQNQEKWKEDGVVIIPNGRTKQDMPLYPSFYQDFLNHPENYNVEAATRSLSIPQFIIHGKKDPAVSYEDALLIKSWNENAELYLIDEADHTYNTKHPFEGSLSQNALEMAKKVATF